MHDSIAEAIARHLCRIADVLERQEYVKDSQISDQQLAELLPAKYESEAKQIIEIVREYKYGPRIVRALKRAGIVAPSTYWCDVKMYIDVQRALFGELDR